MSESTNKNINLNSNKMSESWASKVAGGRNVKIPHRMQNMDTSGEKIVYTIETIYENEQLKEQLRITRAEELIQSSLQDNSVLFEVPKGEFTSLTNLYRLIQTQIGPIIRVVPISQFGNLKGNILVEVTFEKDEDANVAIAEGIIVNEMNFKATPAHINNSSCPPKMTRIFLNYVPGVTHDELVPGLVSSLSIYGKVYEIKKRLHGGFFEGQISALLDLNDDEETNKHVPLQRMLYLHTWDRYVPAEYKGAEAICYQCRKTGHIKKDCPVIKNMTCRRCSEKGHTARYCKMKDEDFANSLNQYEKLMKEQEKKRKEKEMSLKKGLESTMVVKENKEDKIVSASLTVNQTEGKNERVQSKSKDSDMIINDNDDISNDTIIGVISTNKTKDNNIMDANIPMEVDIIDEDKVNPVDFRDGSLASKYAPTSIRTTMDEDKPENEISIKKNEKIVSNTKTMMGLSTKKNINASSSSILRKNTTMTRKSRLDTAVSSSCN